MSKRRVVVTGMGIISPVGNDIDSAWDRVLKGVSGIGPVTHFDTTAYATRIAGQVSGFDPAQWMPVKDVKKMDPFIHYGVAAGTQALRDSGLEVTEANAPRRICHHRHRDGGFLFGQGDVHPQ
jgi:3-oxoacyl-[acyl-carrier-protein] synthase II